MNGQAPTPPASAAPPPPDFGTAIAVVADRAKSFKEVIIAVFAVGATIVSAAIGAWMYFASRTALINMRCVVYAHDTVSAYPAKVDIYELQFDTKSRRINTISGELAHLPKPSQIEQLNMIDLLKSELKAIEDAKRNAHDEYQSALQKLESDDCSAEPKSKALEAGDKK